VLSNDRAPRAHGLELAIARGERGTDAAKEKDADIMRFRTFLTLIGCALLGAVMFGQTLSYDFDRSANFGGFKTYSWVKGTNPLDAINHQRVMGAIDAQLALKGLARVDHNPDMLVAYHATFDQDLRIDGFSSGWGGYRFGGMRNGTATVDEILVGTLAVDLVDARSQSIVWRGVASKEINPKVSPEKREKNINKAAEKLFKNYPPKR
jgi:hypothetical protein